MARDANPQNPAHGHLRRPAQVHDAQDVRAGPGGSRGGVAQYGGLQGHDAVRPKDREVEGTRCECRDVRPHGHGGAGGLQQVQRGRPTDRTSRAERVAARRPRVKVSHGEQREVVERFVAALTKGDVQELMNVLAPDVVMVADGGGLVPSIRKPIEGRQRVLALLSRFRSLRRAWRSRDRSSMARRPLASMLRASRTP